MPSASSKQHRLTDILVDEVSNVDRAANKRNYLVVKRDGETNTMATKLVPDGRGGYTRVSKSESGEQDPSKEETEKDETAKAAPPPFGGNKAPPFGKKPETPEEEAADEEEDDAEKKAKAKARKALELTVKSCVESLVKVLESTQKASEEDDDEEMKAAAKKASDELAKGLGVIAKVAKAGRKMSKERYDRFQTSVKELDKLLQELMSSPEVADAADVGKSFENPTEAGASGTNVGTDEELLQKISNLNEVVAKQSRELEMIRKSVGTSNARGVVEKGEELVDDDAWPMDMNRPITKRGTPKETSFYDE